MEQILGGEHHGGGVDGGVASEALLLEKIPIQIKMHAPLPVKDQTHDRHCPRGKGEKFPHPLGGGKHAEAIRKIASVLGIECVAVK